jgi:hypothetical protein
MDVTGFLCVSLGSSTVQFHDSLGGGPDGHCLGIFLFLYSQFFLRIKKVYVADAHVPRLISVMKMASVLHEYSNEERTYVERFLWTRK